MVIRGKSRSNARQLSHYLLTMKDNEAIRILDIDGQMNPQAEDLHRSIYLMEVSAELSKGDKGLYHAQINPAIGEDKLMNDEQWLQASDILAKQLGLENQRRAIVLHTKKGRTHAHVVWERFDHEQGKMVSDSFSRLAQDRARKEMEQVFSQKPTPHRNKHRPELKASLTELWEKTENSQQFIKAANRRGYLISTGSGRSPFMVVDENGRSYDLTRQLKNVRLKEVRQRLRHEALLDEKQAIEQARKNRSDNAQETGSNGTGKQRAALKPKSKHMQEEFATNQEDMTADNSQKPEKPKLSAREEFRQTVNEITKQNKPQEQQGSAKQQFKENKPDTTGQQTVEDKFKENQKDTTKSDKEKERERRREEFKQRMQPKPGQSQTNKRGMDMD
jgi:hypothetical protein